MNNYKYVDLAHKAINNLFKNAKQRKESNPARKNAYDDLKVLNKLTEIKATKYDVSHFRVYKIDLDPSTKGDEFYVEKKILINWFQKNLPNSRTFNEEIFNAQGSSVGQSDKTQFSQDPVKSFLSQAIRFDDSILRGNNWTYSIASTPAKFQNKAAKTIEREANKYPLNILQENLSTISIFQKIRFPINGKGYEYAGTYNGKNLILKNDYELAKTFHHEFSSVLMQQYPRETKMLKEEFYSLSPQYTFGGPYGGVKFLAKYEEGQIKFDAYTQTLFSKGFVNSYGTSTFEEDVNTLSEDLFAGEKRLWEAYNKLENNKVKYPLLRAKIDSLIAFYNRIDSQFTKAYFQSFVS
ncbi:MAG: hypothetical protein QNJ31_04085 [Candidatus Caenarcaniphilales bacterium]|nr:hypothetical protein [Candidatus Caenarcaniphilales bacterium]